LGRVIIPLNRRPFVVKRLAKVSGLGADYIKKIFDRGYGCGDEFWSAVRDFDTGKLRPDQFYRRIKKMLKLCIGIDDFVEIWQTMLSVDERFVELLWRLKARGVRRGIISDLCIIHYYRVMELLPRDLFDNLFFSFMEKCLKRDSNGIVFERAIRAANLPPEKILFIDDIEINIETARGRGMRTFHYQDNFEEFVRHLNSLGVGV